MHYPRMLFWQGTDERICVVADAAEQAAKVAEGWQTRPLPGEPGDGEPDAVVAPDEPPADAPPADAPPAREKPAREKPGPKPKPPTE